MRPEDGYMGAAAHQLAIAQKLKLKLKLKLKRADQESLDDATDVIVDGMVGYSLRGRPKGTVADCIRWATAHPAPVLALDLPTGLDATTGETRGQSIKATATMTLALPKAGLAVMGAEEFTGALYLADIGVPEVVYRRMGFDVGPIFSGSDLLRLS